MTKLKFAGVEVKTKLPISKNSIWMNPSTFSPLFKKWVKKNFPKYVARVKSESFAGGNSFNVWISNPDGSSIPKNDFSKISNFAKTFRMGKFNGMIDSYEYDNTDNLFSESGIRLESGIKYVSVYNEPKFGSSEWKIWESRK